jgi:hypothetical protein
VLMPHPSSSQIPSNWLWPIRNRRCLTCSGNFRKVFFWRTN